MTLKLRYAFTENESLTPSTEAPSTTPALSIIRAGDTATVRDSNGLVVAVSADTGRFDHDWDGTPLGLLVEETRTNIALHSNDWTNAVYNTVTNITPLKDATGPDGVANSASTLTATADNGVISQAITVASAAFTTSVLMRRKTGTGTVEITDNGFTNATDITADINSSTWTQVGGITRTQANPVVGIRLGTSGDEVEVAYLQVEAGAFLTSPILTTTASVTRNADNIDTTDMSWLNTDAGTFYASASWSPEDNGQANMIFEVNDNSSSDRYLLYKGTVTGRLDLDLISSAGDNVSINGAGIVSDGVTVRGVYGYAKDDVAFYADGSLVAADSTFDPTSNLLTLDIGQNYANGNSTNGHIKEIRYYDERLDNTGLENLSNGLFPIPDVVGLTESAATTILEANGFVVAIGVAVYSPTVALGSVVSQDDVAGAYVANGTTVTIALSLGPEPSTGGRSKKGRKYSVEVDNEIFTFNTIAEAQEFLLLTKETAEQAAQVELQRAEKTKTPVKVPRVRVKLVTGKPSSSQALADAQAEAERAIQDAYQKAAEARIQKLAQIAKDTHGKGIQTRADMSRKAKEKRQKQLDELEALIALLL